MVADAANPTTKDYDELKEKVTALEKRIEEAEGMKDRLCQMEKAIKELQEKGEAAREQVGMLRDRLEESEWSKQTVEDKLKDMKRVEEEVEKVRMEVVKERSERKKWESAVKADKELWVKELEKMEKRLVDKMDSMKGERNGGGDRAAISEERGRLADLNRGGERPEWNPGRKRCVIFTDSNGKETKGNSVKNHIPRNQRDSMDITIIVAYEIDDAVRMLARGEVNVMGATVIIDNLTNDVRGTRRRPPATPEELIQRLDRLGRRLRMAEDIVVCQIKPMQDKDVSPYNGLLNDYLFSNGVWGCHTQIRMEQLKPDGYHILPQFGSLLDRQYACAILGLEVPFPTPPENFVPDHVGRRYEGEWPRLDGRGVRSEGQNPNHGWRW